MSTKYIVLTLLKMAPDSGYGLAYRNVSSMAPLWSATHSQIYTTLRALLEEGLVTARTGDNGGRRERTVYTLTDAGRKELERWQSEPIRYLPRRDPFRFRMAHMDEMPADAVALAIDRHIRRHERMQEQLTREATALATGTNKEFEKRHAHLPKAELLRVRRVRSAAYEEMSRLARFEVESGERLRKLATELHRGSAPKKRARQKPAKIVKPPAPRP